MASWSSPSSSLSALGCPSPSNDISLSATVFGMNRLSVQNRPRNVLKCLEADRSGLNKSGLLSRELYLSDGLEKADRMYTADVFGHHSCVNTVALSNLGQEFVVSGGDDQRVLVWKMGDVIQAGVHDPKPIIMTTHHTSNIFTAEFSCDNQFVFSGGDDSELLKHDFGTGQVISRHEHLDAVYSVTPHPNLPSVVLTASADGCVYTIDTREPYKRVHGDMVLCEDMDSYHCVVINPVVQRLAAVCNSYNGTSLYDTRQKKRLLHYKITRWPTVREDSVSACFDSTGSQLYVMHRTFPPCLFDIYDEHTKVCFVDNTSNYKNLVTMKSGCFMGEKDEYVVSGSDDFRVYIWKIPENKEGVEEYHGDLDIDSGLSAMPHLVLPGHRSIVNQTCYSKVHRVLLTSGVEKIIKVWSHEQLNSSNKVSHSRAPPSRERYSLSQMESLVNSPPANPLSEDPSVLAFFDSLIDQDENVLYYSSSTDLDSDDDTSANYFVDMLVHGQFPFRGLLLSSDEEGDDGRSNSYLTDSEESLVSYNSSSVEPPWLEEEMEELDEELREAYGSGSDEWSSCESGEHAGSSESEDDGRVGRISNHHDEENGDEEEEERVRSRGDRQRTVERRRAHTGTNEDRGSEVSGRGGKGTASDAKRKRPHSQPELTRRQPPRKIKTTSSEERSSHPSNNCKSSEHLQDSADTANMPQSIVKSAQANKSSTNGHEVVTVTNSKSVASSLGGAGTSGVSSSEASASGRGPSRRWTRRMNRRQQDEAGIEPNYEQYHVEDFLKPKPPSSFYSKKDNT